MHQPDCSVGQRTDGAVPGHPEHLLGERKVFALGEGPLYALDLLHLFPEDGHGGAIPGNWGSLVDDVLNGKPG